MSRWTRTEYKALPGRASVQEAAKLLWPRRSLLEQVFARENMQRAWKCVKANKGAAGIGGLDINQTAEYLQWAWPELRQQLLEGSYRPQPVRRLGIPKPDGSERELGIPPSPTV